MKVLIITYYWPPAGGPGVQRWLKFVKYLPEHGIEPVVYIPENPTYPLRDESLTAELSKDVTILKGRIFEPYSFASTFSKKDTTTISSGIIKPAEKQTFVARFLLYIRGNYFIPDARKYWVKPSVKFLKKYLKENTIDTVITTGPPHSVHLIGLALKKQLGMRWLADFRDPWTTIGYHKKLKLTKRSQRKHKTLEKTVLQSADSILVTSPSTASQFSSITSQPIQIITNGYDSVEPIAVKVDKRFVVAHIGSLLSGRDPEILWRILQYLIKHQEGFAKYFCLQIVGAVSESVLSSIEEHGLMSYVERIGYIPHNEAQVLQRKAQLLLLIEIDSPETNCIIPGKLFEYMAAKRPIIAIGPKDSDIKKILEDTNAGTFHDYRDSKRLQTVLNNHFKAYLQSNLKVDSKGIAAYSRSALTQELSALIHS